MPRVKWSIEQLGRLLYKSRHEPRRNQKRYLKDGGGDGSAAELDALLETAKKDKHLIAEADRLDALRKHTARTVELGMVGQVAEMIADIRLRMEEQEITQQELADRCGWKQPLVGAYLTGGKEPGIGNLAKMAGALGCKWRLQEVD